MEITLTVIAGPLNGKIYTFPRPDRFLVGRARRAHLRLERKGDKDPRASRLHLLIEVNPPLCRLYDLDSHNGTHVNGQRVTTQDLRHGNEIRVGHTVLRVGLSDDATEELKALPPMPDVIAPAKPETPASAPTLCLCCSANPPEPTQAVCPECLRRARQAPQPLPGYLLLRELGRGGLGTVHLAVRLTDAVPLAVKTIKPEGGARPDLVERFLAEANALRALRHEHIVAYHEMGAAGDRLYFSMDYLPGIDAGHFLKQRGRLSIKSAVRIIVGVLQALEYAHQHQFVHGDVKPANLLLDGTGKHRRVKLADFGLSRIYQGSLLSGLTLPRELDGSLAFLPPEMLTNFHRVQPSSDQYAAAATLYTLLTGRGIRDLNGPLHLQLSKVLKEEPVPIQNRRDDLPDRLAAVIHRALARSPRKRFADIKQFRRARPFAS